MAEEITAAVQQPEPAAPAEPAAKETAPPAEPTAKEPEATPAEPAKKEEKLAAAAAASEPAASSAAAGEDEAAKKTAEKIANLEGKVHALSVGAKPEAVGDLLTLAAANVGEGKTLEQAIDEILEKYPVFKSAEPPTITTSVDTKNDTPTEQTDAFINRVMGIK